MQFPASEHVRLTSHPWHLKNEPDHDGLGLGAHGLPLVGVDVLVEAQGGVLVGSVDHDQLVVMGVPDQGVPDLPLIRVEPEIDLLSFCFL